MLATPENISRKTLLQMQRGDVSVKSTALIIFLQGITTTPALIMSGSQGHPEVMALEYVLCFFTYLVVAVLIWKIGDRSEWYEKPSFYMRKEMPALCFTLLSPIFALFIALCVLAVFFPYLPGYQYTIILSLSIFGGTVLGLMALFVIAILLYR